MFRCSSAVEQLTVNQLVVGSIPTAGANNPFGVSYLKETRFGGFFCFSGFVTAFAVVAGNAPGHNPAPPDAVGGSNAAMAATQEPVCRGGDLVRPRLPILTAKRSSSESASFARTGAVAGDVAVVEMLAPYRYRVSLKRVAAASES